MNNLKWKKDYGDGSYTEDTILWIDGEPTDNIISPSSGFYVVYVNGIKEYITDNRKDARDYILNALGLR